MLENWICVFDAVIDPVDDIAQIGKLFRVECRSEQLIEALNQ